jgi:hypothetical protein
MHRSGLGRGVIDLGLGRIRTVLAQLGHPEKMLDGRVVHVGGTNGKGSVCAYIAAALRADGHRVGVFTSPHLVSTVCSAIPALPCLPRLPCRLAALHCQLDPCQAGGCMPHPAGC